MKLARQLALVALALAWPCLGSCQGNELPAPDLEAIRLPTGLALSPNGDWLFVTNGNWDRQEDGGTLVMIDVERLDDGIADARSPGSDLSQGRPCREATPNGRVECDPAPLIDADDTVVLGSGTGNIAIDRPKGTDGPLRLLIPSRIDPQVAWIDVSGADGDELDVDCGQLGDRKCDGLHTLPTADDPANIAVDESGARFAYLPHLLEDEDCDGDDCSGITLIALDGEFGPEVVDQERDFFRLDPIHDSGLRGGFSVAQRACDLDTGNVPTESRNCERPVLYASQRFWAGIRVFRIALGLDVVLAGRESSILGVNVDNAIARPLMGDLGFEDPATGERLLIVHTTPPGLSRVDTSLGDNATPVDDLMHSLPVCQNPNMLEIYRPEDAEQLAFVSCYGVGEVAVVGLASFSIMATLNLGEGANEMVIDDERKRLYVANTLESTISIVDLDRLSGRFLDEVAVIGLGSER